MRGQLAGVIRSSFASSLDEILLIGGIACLCAAVLSLLLIRQKDFAKGSATYVAKADDTTLASTDGAEQRAATNH
jgi:hypothetical protein